MPLVTPSPRAPAPQRRSLSGFLRDRRGVSAVEFALIAPVLIVFYFGMAELTEAMMAQRRLNLLASSIGDVVARNTKFTDAQRTDIFNIGTVLMAPFPSSGLKMCIVSVVSDSSGKDTVAWSESYNAPTNCPAANAVLTDVPTSVLPSSQSVIMSKASYDYTPPVRLIMSKGITFRRTLYLRPRLSDTVTRSST
jgi:Flp pilus assembly protein TadG